MKNKMEVHEEGALKIT